MNLFSFWHRKSELRGKLVAPWGAGTARGGIRLSFLLLFLGGLVYVGYVGGGLVFGLTTITGAFRGTTNPIQISLPLLPPGLSLPRISLPMITSPLALIPDWGGSERVNILVLGVDQRDDERSIGLPTRSDTLMIASLDPEQRTAALISFPRDLWVAIPGFGEERINAAYRIGELRRVEGGGAALAAQTIDRNFGLRASYFVLVDFRGFEDIIDGVGGVVIDVPRPLKDDEYPTYDYGLERVYFMPGPQHMNGATALKYARTRHSDSDFARMTRQQQVLMSLRDRALRLNMVAQMPSLMDQGMKAIQTNLSPTEILSLAKLASQIETSAMSNLVVEGNLVTSFRGIGGAALLAPRRAEIQSAVQRTLADPRMVAEGARIEVTASAGMARLSREVVDRLAVQGLHGVRLVTAAGGEPENTVLVTSGQKPRTTASVLRALGLPESVQSQSVAQEPNVDIRLILGRDFEASAAR